MNETLQRLQAIPVEMKGLENQALQHEQAARDCRAAREKLKLEQSELQRVINDTKVVHAVESSLSAAQASQQAAEAAKIEASAVLDRLKTQESTLTAKEKRLDELLAKLEAPTPVDTTTDAI